MILNLVKLIVIFILMLGLAWFNYDIMQSGRAEEAWRNPFLMLILCGMGMLVSVFWMIVELLKLPFSDNPEVMARLNGDFWTVILGPVKKDL